MMSKNTEIRLVVAVVACLLLIGIFLFLRRDRTVEVANFDECIAAGYVVIDSFPRRCLDGENNVHTEDVGNMLEMRGVIELTAPERNTIITSPLIVAGRAKKEWFTDGKISGLLIDTDGVVLGEIAAEAEKGKVSEGFQKFSGKMEWNVRDTKAIKGSIILKKERMSDTGNEIRMPVFLRPWD